MIGKTNLTAPPACTVLRKRARVRERSVPKAARGENIKKSRIGPLDNRFACATIPTSIGSRLLRSCAAGATTPYTPYHAFDRYGPMNKLGQ
mmetsp:Transcript_26156/g.73245  ORF Transcript_26156/g.73245 Transcript_26156/m.73245 type:complete len:91 (+) Transcript_26156:88-360(+)